MGSPTPEPPAPPSVVRVATGNPHKVEELLAILAGWPLATLTGIPPYPPEDAATYLGNARIKARHGRAHAEPGAWVIAEDSGIEVDGLGGAPGIHSARFGGDDPVGRLLAALDEPGPGPGAGAGVGPGDGARRRGRYRAELVCLLPDGTELVGSGTLEGHVALVPAGSEGFGYDPVFVPAGQSRTVAELGDGWKALHSHRARATQALLDAARAARLVP